MKTSIFRTFFSTLIIVSTIGFVSCSQDDESASNGSETLVSNPLLKRIIGTWEYVESSGYGIAFTFYENGTGYETIIMPNPDESSNYSYNYVIKEKTLSIYLGGGDTPSFEYTIVSITSTYLKIQQSDGSKIRLKKKQI